MSQQDLETYQVQLEQVDEALKADPDNEEFQSLRSELNQLITLTEQAIAVASASSASTAKKSHKGVTLPVFTAGDECLAKWSKDDKWYPGRITSVGGSEEKRVYSVVFRGYQDIEVVNANAVKRLPPSQAGPHGVAPSSTAGTKRKLSKEEEEEREKKKRKNEKKLEVRAAKAAEQDQKKQSWQKFATKSAKKGVAVPGLVGTSIFKTPDNPHGRGRRFMSDVWHNG